MATTSQSMFGTLKRVVVKRPEDAFRSKERIEAEWKSIGFTAQPDLALASSEHESFVELLRNSGAEILYLPADGRTGLDSLYTYDPVLVTDFGLILLQTGKENRRGEALAYQDAFKEWGLPILGSVGGDATAEGGDMFWLDPKTLVIGRSYRTNQAGVRAISEMLLPHGVTVVEVHLPHWHGREDLLHLLSVISPLDQNLAVVYAPLLPIPLVELLSDAGVELVSIPGEEFASQGSNVLALGPRSVVMLEGNPKTQKLLSDAGCKVQVFKGKEISFKGHGGPTCMTRPLLREF